MILRAYRCHKVVRAARILNITDGTARSAFPGGSWLLWFGQSLAEAIEVSAEWFGKHQPVCGGYYVVYDDGEYASFSPARAFESGYTVVDAVAAQGPARQGASDEAVRQAARDKLLAYFEDRTADGTKANAAILVLGTLRGPQS